MERSDSTAGSDAGEIPVRSAALVCGATRVDGTPCRSRPVSGEERCIGHRATANDARRAGGRATTRAARADRLLPARLRPIATRLERAMEEVHNGKLDPRVATALASLASALVRVSAAGELEERMRGLEARLGGTG